MRAAPRGQNVAGLSWATSAETASSIRAAINAELRMAAAGACVEPNGVRWYGSLNGRLMPTVLRISGYRFFFYSLEGSEPPHIHVEHGDDVAKFWLEPVSLAECHGFRVHEVTRLRALVIEHRILFLEAWHEHFAC